MEIAGLEKDENFLEDNQKTTGAQLEEGSLCLDIDMIAEDEASVAEAITEEKSSIEMLEGIVSLEEKSAEDKKEMCEMEKGEDIQVADVGEDDGGVFGEWMAKIFGSY